MGMMKEIATRLATDPNLVGADPGSKAMRDVVRQCLAARRPRRSDTSCRPAQNKRGRCRRKHRASDLATFPLSFGRYRNWPMESVPIDYLHWMLTAKHTPIADRWAAERYLQAVAGSDRHQGTRQRVSV